MAKRYDLSNIYSVEIETFRMQIQYLSERYHRKSNRFYYSRNRLEIEGNNNLIAKNFRILLIINILNNDYTTKTNPLGNFVNANFSISCATLQL